MQQEDIWKRITRLNDNLTTRQESIKLLKGRLRNQITSFKEMITKLLGKDATLGERIRMLFQEQGIAITSVLTAIGMAIGILIEALLPDGGTAAKDTPLPEDEKGAKEWLRNKLKALALLPGRLGTKVAEALPGFIGMIITSILNRAKEVVGWVFQNSWALAIGVRGLLYPFMATRRGHTE